MNTKDINLYTPMSLTLRRRGLGLGLAALAVFGGSACAEDGADALGEFEDAEFEDDAEESEAVAVEGADELAAQDDPSEFANVQILAAVYGTDLVLTQELDPAMPWSTRVLEVRSSDGTLLHEQQVSIFDVITWHGTDGADSLDASALSNKVLAFGYDGDDTIITGSGPDSISGGAGSDVLDGNGGNDQIDGGTGSDTISGGNGDDRIDAGEGGDNVDAGSGDDIIEGGGGSDVIHGGDGDDYMFARYMTAGADNKADELHGGDGVDLAVMGAGDLGSSTSATATVFGASRLFCMLYDGDMITMESVDSGEYVSAANNGTDKVGVYLKTEPSVGNSEKFMVSCENDQPRLIWRRVGYGYGNLWDGSGYDYATTEVAGGVYAGPNGNLSDDDLEWLRDLVEPFFLRGSAADAVTNPSGPVNPAAFDPATGGWTFVSWFDSSIRWEVGNPYITYDDDNSIDDDNVFYIEHTTGW